MNLRETRVLNAVQRLGSPTTMDVAYQGALTTAEARATLRGLASVGLILGEGRHWTVPSRALPIHRPRAPKGISRAHFIAQVMMWVAAGSAIFCIALAIESCASHVSHGGF